MSISYKGNHDVLLHDNPRTVYSVDGLITAKTWASDSFTKLPVPIDKNVLKVLSQRGDILGKNCTAQLHPKTLSILN